MAYTPKPQDKRIEKIEEEIEESETKKAVELVNESEAENKPYVSNDIDSYSSTSVSIKETEDLYAAPVSKQIELVQTYQHEALENYKQLAESYIDLQKKMLDAWIPYFEDISKKIYENFTSPGAISDMYYKYITGISNFTKAWNRNFNLLSQGT
jgi:hypothetical protein